MNEFIKTISAVLVGSIIGLCGVLLTVRSEEKRQHKIKVIEAVNQGIKSYVSYLKSKDWAGTTHTMQEINNEKHAYLDYQAALFQLQILGEKKVVDEFKVLQTEIKDTGSLPSVVAFEKEASVMAERIYSKIKK